MRRGGNEDADPKDTDSGWEERWGGGKVGKTTCCDGAIRPHLGARDQSGLVPYRGCADLVFGGVVVLLWQVMGPGVCLDMGIGNTYLEGGLVRILQTSLSLLHGPLIPSLVAVPSSLSLRPSPRRKDTAWSECDGRQRLTETD